MDPRSEIPPEVLSYFRAWIKDQLHDLVVHEFLKQKSERPDLTQAEIARRLGRRPEQINRWLATPGNWTLETVSDLLFAIANCTATVSVQPIELRNVRNHPAGPDWAINLPVAGTALPSMSPLQGMVWDKHLSQQQSSMESSTQNGPIFESIQLIGGTDE